MSTQKNKSFLGKEKRKNAVNKSVHRKSPLITDTWEGKIERVAWGGLGISRLEDGRLLLLESPLALFPGEIVRADIRRKSKHAEGKILSWIEHSPLRSSPECPVAELCGGCDLQGAGNHHSDLKKKMVEDLFHRMLPGQAWDWLPAPEDARRHRIQLHWNGRDLGFHQRQKHTIVPIASCPAASAKISDSIPRFHEAITFKMLSSRPQRWELVTGTPPTELFAIDETKKIWELEPDGWHRTEKSVTHFFAGHKLTHKPGGFFQVSAKWAAEAFQKILAQWNPHGNTLYDLYGGVGIFSIIMGSGYENRILVESDSDSIAHARRNLKNAKLKHQCIEANVAEWLPNDLGNHSDTVLLDPPRTGITPEIAQKLLTSNAGTLILIGCDGAAFCRDIKRLSQVWTLKKLAVVDLFPMTVHVECIGLMEKKK